MHLCRPPSTQALAKFCKCRIPSGVLSATKVQLTGLCTCRIIPVLGLMEGGRGEVLYVKWLPKLHETLIWRCSPQLHSYNNEQAKPQKPQPHFPEVASNIMINKKDGIDSSTIFHFYSKHLASK